MPELPEVETIVLILKDCLIQHQIIAVETDWSKSLPIDQQVVEQAVIGAKIVNLRRKGKMILIDLDTRQTLVVHLKMTGSLVYCRQQVNQTTYQLGAGHPSDSLVGQLPDRSTRVTFTLDQQAHLFFNDARKFGWIKLLATELVEETDFIAQLGPDLLTVSSADFQQRFKQRHKSIKTCLLDQRIVAGCGNIYADEALWQSRIHPMMSASQLSQQQLEVLRQELQRVVRFSIKQGGSSSRNYINPRGEKGRYLNFVKVYQRAGQPCPRCSASIKRLVVSGRGTHICTICQVKKG